MQICSKCHIQMHDEVVVCTNCEADLREWSNSAVSLRKIQENPRITYVRVAVNEDCCPACRDIEGAYAKNAAPILPIKGCSHQLGCRCYYQPVLDEIYP